MEVEKTHVKPSNKIILLIKVIFQIKLIFDFGLKENIKKSNKNSKKFLKEIKYEIIDGIYVLPPVVKNHTITI